jgi:hypothetical protein
MPPQLKPKYLTADRLQCKIPKLHAEAHSWKCQPFFSLNYTKGAGRGDFEWHERGFLGTNNIANSMNEMGPAHCCEVLDDTFHYHNFKKFTDLGASFACVDIYNLKLILH